MSRIRATFILAVGLFFLISSASAKIVSMRPGLQLVAESDVVVAINASEFTYVNDGGSDWIVLEPKNLKVFKGSIGKEPIWIRSIYPNMYKDRSTHKLENSPWLLSFLRGRSDGRFEYSTDHLLQAETQLPQSVNPMKSGNFVDMLVSCLDESNDQDKVRYAWLLAGIPSSRAVSALDSISKSADINLKTEALVARILSGDMSAWVAAGVLIKSGALKGGNRIQLEAVFAVRQALHDRVTTEDYRARLGISLHDIIPMDSDADDSSK